MTHISLAKVYSKRFSKLMGSVDINESTGKVKIRAEGQEYIIHISNCDILRIPTEEDFY